jgi:ABC-type bacteriocin/lantibiotic exporter with double-glycine peptidase domain
MKEWLLGEVRMRRALPLLSFFYSLLGTAGIVKLFLSGLVISLIELGGLALIFPYIKLVTDADFHHKLLSLFQGTAVAALLEDHFRAVVAVGGGLIAVYLARGYVNARLVRYQTDLAADINSQTSERIIRNSLQSRYQLFLEHSPVKIAGVSYSNTTHASLLLQATASAFNEMLLLSFLLFAFIALSPGLSLGLILLGGVAAWGFFLPLLRRISMIGKKTQEIDLARHRFVFTMASAIRDIKIMGLELPFVNRNRAMAESHAKLTANYQSITGLQHVFVEVIFGCGVVASCIWFAYAGGDLNQLAPALVTVVFLALRAVPGLSRLAASYSRFRYSLPFVEALLEMQEEIKKFPQTRVDQSPDFPGDYVVEGVSFSYGSREVLRGCTLTIHQGEVVAVIGPSGAGKSTLLDLLSGLQPAAGGTFRLNGVYFSPFESRRFSERVGYVPQSIALLDDSLQFNIALEDNPDPERLENAVKKANLTAMIEALPEGLNTKLGEGGQGLSGGQRQRLGIARALYRQPALLILDEVTSALDGATAAAVMHELLQLRGQTSLLIVSHNLRDISADRIYQLVSGQLLEVKSGDQERVGVVS